jgi:translation elongation factor EF-Ts
MSGISYATIYNWMNADGEKINPERLEVLKNIQECHKMEQIGLLNDSPVGALAVANNDTETGLEWSKQNAQQIASNTVYILPSERVDKLRITKEQE